MIGTHLIGSFQSRPLASQQRLGGGPFLCEVSACSDKKTQEQKKPKFQIMQQTSHQRFTKQTRYTILRHNLAGVKRPTQLFEKFTERRKILQTKRNLE